MTAQRGDSDAPAPDPRFRDQLAEVAARWAADPGEPISDEEWDTLAGGFRAFLHSRAALLADALLPLVEARESALRHQRDTALRSLEDHRQAADRHAQELARVQAAANRRAAEELNTAADDYQRGLGAVAPEVPMSLSQFAPWLRKRADALTPRPDGDVATKPYPCYCLPGPARCDDPYNWCDRAAALAQPAPSEAER